MITIVTPVLNGRRFIEGCIESIKKLKVTVEHIIVDGGSDDGTVELVKEKYPNILLVEQQIGNGMYGAIHQGFTNSKYDTISWVNSDDQIVAKNYEKAIFAIKTGKYNFAYGDSIYHWFNKKTFTDAKANPCAKFFLKKGILPFVQPSSLYNKELYFEVPLRYDKFRICGDLDLFMRMARCSSFKPVYINKPMSVFCKYGNSLGDRSEDQYYQERKLLYKSPTIFDKIIYKITNILK